MITAWSHSRLVVYEQCPFHLKLKYIDKIPEPIRPLPSGKKEHANERGTRIHEAAELFVLGGVELIPELGHFAEELHQLRDLYEKGTVSLEGDWGFNYDWEPVGWTSEDIWGRVKLDAFVQPDPEAAIIIDYKSGKKYGNEIKHGEQGQLYMLAAFMKYPEIKEVTVEFWYTDQNDMTRMLYKESMLGRYKSKWEKRINAMLSDTKFEPRPNVYSCKWCPYKPAPEGSGDCPHGILHSVARRDLS